MLLVKMFEGQFGYIYQDCKCTYPLIQQYHYWEWIQWKLTNSPPPPLHQPKGNGVLLLVDFANFNGVNTSTMVNFKLFSWRQSSSWNSWNFNNWLLQAPMSLPQHITEYSLEFAKGYMYEIARLCIMTKELKHFKWPTIENCLN